MSLLMNQIVLNATRMAGEPPIVLPAKTLRFKFTNTSYTPVAGTTSTIGTWTAVNASQGIWDWYANVTSWRNAFNSCLKESVIGQNNTVSVIAAGDSSAITDTYFMFYNCDNLTSTVLFDTSNVTIMQAMFYRCYKLTTSPAFNINKSTNIVRMFQECSSLESLPIFTRNGTTSNVNANYFCWKCTSLKNVPLLNMTEVSSMAYMFSGCVNVESGAYDLYLEAINKVSTHQYAFQNCGSNTTTGAAELAQIPSGWK